MLLVADVHGANQALARVAARGEALLILGDLLDLVDYRTGDGLLATLVGRELVVEIIGLRRGGDPAAARRRWRAFVEGREQEFAAAYDHLAREAYQETAAALEGAEAYVTYGNSDRPDLLAQALPAGSRLVDGETLEIEGTRVGFVGGGAPRLGVPGEVSEEAMAAKLSALGEVEVLCTHVAPAVLPLSRDVIGGPPKHSDAVLEYLLRNRPRRHYFGDIHQPQAVSWRVGGTLCCNVGYFKATGRPFRHG